MARDYFPGMGSAVADRTINRPGEKWIDVAARVAEGNVLLHPESNDREILEAHLAQASILLSGRHLQHGDADQPKRPQEVYTNCLDGSTRILTMEYGPVEIGAIAGQDVTVIAGDGMPREAHIHFHGEQELYDITFRLHPLNGAKVRKVVRATKDHRWILRDGSITTSLSVSDIIAPASAIAQNDQEAIIHGLVFGDGTAHKSRRDYSRPGVSQGRTYASIRVCKTDVVKDEIHTIFDEAGYRYSTPPSSDGDRVYYVGKFAHAKELPFTTDPNYIAGFIYGWWLADGHKGVRPALEISTADEQAAAWLEEHAGYAGFVATTHRVMERKEGDGSFANGKALHVIRLRRNVEWAVESIEPAGSGPVFCPEEPVTGAFVLGNGLLTGNCSTSMLRCLTFKLLLSGSGVGGCYDDDLMLVDWAAKMPIVVPVIEMSHPDVARGLATGYMTKRDALHFYGDSEVVVFTVPDTREGWAKAVEKVEALAYQGTHHDAVLILDFSKVREQGRPIRGMQNRPASGPGPLMAALTNVAKVRNSGMAPWKAAMYIDHFLAECVLVGGARRAARIAVKHWRDETIFEFIAVKRPTEFEGLGMQEVIALRKRGAHNSFLWSSNNSIAIDSEFEMFVEAVRGWAAENPGQDVDTAPFSYWMRHAYKVWVAAGEAQYGDGTGEPGFLNVDLLDHNEEGLNEYYFTAFAGNDLYRFDDEIMPLVTDLTYQVLAHDYQMIVNPCVPGETRILTRDGYQTIHSTVGREIEVWNGHQFSKVTPFSTGVNPLVTVKLSDGTELTCTPAHKFVVQEGYRGKPYKVEASKLKKGQKLAKFQMPIVESGIEYEVDAYSQGFYSGDGNEGYDWSWVYEPKLVCSSRLDGTVGELTKYGRAVWKHGRRYAKDFVPINGSLRYRRDWLAGILDTDGTVVRDENGNGIQLSSINLDFLKDIRLLLTTLGVQAKLNQSHEAKVWQGYECQPCYRLLINSTDTYHLVTKVGVTFERLEVHANPPQRDARRFVTVLEVEDTGRTEETFCFTEPVNHTGTFEGIVTGQCGEIPLFMLAGFCVIGDVVPFHAQDDFDAEEAFRQTARALIRVNRMSSVYDQEVRRTNRIGVSITGLHEYAWDRFGLGFRDLVAEDPDRTVMIDANGEEIIAPHPDAMPFWLQLLHFAKAVEDEATRYATELGMVVPHTMRTIKPAGTTSKLFGLTEGAHLPPMREYLRWVQFRHDDPLVAIYRAGGYPVRDLKEYKGTTIVGFPTAPVITQLGMGNKLVTAGEATPTEQFRWIRLLETFWIGASRGNQVSYTLKYDPKIVSFKAFEQTMFENVRKVRAVSVLPLEDTSSYEYLPETAVSKAEFERIVAAIQDVQKEDVDRVHVDCASGACPIVFEKELNA